MTVFLLGFGLGLIVATLVEMLAYFLIWGITPGNTFGPFFRRRR